MLPSKYIKKERVLTIIVAGLIKFMEHMQSLSTVETPNYDLLIKCLRDEKVRIFIKTGVSDNSIISSAVTLHQINKLFYRYLRRILYSCDSACIYQLTSSW